MQDSVEYASAIFSTIVERGVEEVRSLLMLALCLLLVSVIRKRRNFRGIYLQCTPSSLRVNCLIYVLNALVLAIPYAVLASASYEFVLRNGPLLIRPERFDAAPAWLVVIAALVFVDFVNYFLHRMLHTVWLWPVHELHHSDEQMTWFTEHRGHPLNMAFVFAVDFMAFAAVGFPLWAIGAASVIASYYTYFIHSNLPWTLGRFGKIIVSPAMHRWHHARDSSKGRNFAGMFAFIDVLFGTFYCPGVCMKATGVEGAKQSEFLWLLTEPFITLARTWSGLVLGRRRSRPR
ncbi:sterol desaturase family protein [Variovorax sp. dw_954]|uniref:sterol desaturase family protein n=1 Tax=Variovorax sp. dw_954 TaxID=2720078 RepID=UPI001BD490D1